MRRINEGIALMDLYVISVSANGARGGKNTRFGAWNRYDGDHLHENVSTLVMFFSALLQILNLLFILWQNNRNWNNCDAI